MPVTQQPVAAAPVKQCRKRYLLFFSSCTADMLNTAIYFIDRQQHTAVLASSENRQRLKTGSIIGRITDSFCTVTVTCFSIMMAAYAKTGRAGAIIFLNASENDGTLHEITFFQQAPLWLILITLSDGYTMERGLIYQMEEQHNGIIRDGYRWVCLLRVNDRSFFFKKERTNGIKHPVVLWLKITFSATALAPSAGLTTRWR